MQSGLTQIGLARWERRLAEESTAGRLRRLGERLLRKPTAAIGLVVLAIIVLTAITAPVIAPYPAYDLHMKDRLVGPSLRYLMGTDETGRDLLSNLLFAGRISLLVGVGAEVIAVLLGLPLGLLAGFSPGLIDDAIMRFLRESLGTATGSLGFHHGHHPEIELDGPTAARGIWALDNYLFNAGKKRGVRIAAYYDDRYVKVGDEWKIAHTGYTYVFHEEWSRDDIPSLRVLAP